MKVIYPHRFQPQFIMITGVYIIGYPGCSVYQIVVYLDHEQGQPVQYVHIADTESYQKVTETCILHSIYSAKDIS